MNQVRLHLLAERAVDALEHIAKALEGVAFPDRAVIVGERLWYCQYGFGVGGLARRPSPYCPGPGADPAVHHDAVLHTDCGWGMWTPEGRA